MGRTECPDLNGLRASLGLEKATPSKRAKWRSSLSAYSSALKKFLTRADIVREACLRQLPATENILQDTPQNAVPHVVENEEFCLMNGGDPVPDSDLERAREL